MTFRDWGQIVTVTDKIQCEGAWIKDDGANGYRMKGQRGKKGAN